MTGPDNVKGNHCKHVVRAFILLPIYQADFSCVIQLFIFLKGQLILAHKNRFNRLRYVLVLQVSQQSGLWYQKFAEVSAFTILAINEGFQGLAYERAPANFCGSTSGPQLHGPYPHPRCICSCHRQGDHIHSSRHYLQHEQAHSWARRRLPYLLRWYAWCRRGIPCFLRGVW
jgi:hypothetical protein